MELNNSNRKRKQNKSTKTKNSTKKRRFNTHVYQKYVKLLENNSNKNKNEDLINSNFDLLDKSNVLMKTINDERKRKYKFSGDDIKYKKRKINNKKGKIISLQNQTSLFNFDINYFFKNQEIFFQKYSSLFKFIMNQKQINTLNENQMIEDNVINFFIKYFYCLLDENLLDKISIFNSFFISKIVEQNPTFHPKKWIYKNNSQNKNIWIIPIHMREHWFLILIKFSKINNSYSIYIFDSLQNYLKNEQKQIFYSLFKTLSTIKINNKKYTNYRTFHVEVQQQNNNYDCGLFLINNIYYLFKYISSPQNFQSLTNKKIKNFFLNQKTIKFSRIDFKRIVETFRILKNINFKSKIIANQEKKIKINTQDKDKTLKKDSSTTGSPIGLINFGSTCYINAIIQQLQSVSLLRHKLSTKFKAQKKISN